MLIIAYLAFLLIIFLIIAAFFLLSRRILQSPVPAAKHLKERADEEFSKELSPAIDYWWKGGGTSVPQTPELPDKYPENRLFLMVQNPYCLFTYWNLSDDLLSQGSPLLRVFEHGIREYHQIDESSLEKSVKSYYCHVPKAECTYHVEIGLKLADGRFILLLRSNDVTTPRDSISTVLDPDWMPCDVYSGLNRLSYGTSSADWNRGGEK